MRGPLPVWRGRSRSAAVRPRETPAAWAASLARMASGSRTACAGPRRTLRRGRGGCRVGASADPSRYAAWAASPRPGRRRPSRRRPRSPPTACSPRVGAEPVGAQRPEDRGLVLVHRAGVRAAPWCWPRPLTPPSPVRSLLEGGLAELSAGHRRLGQVVRWPRCSAAGSAPARRPAVVGRRPARWLAAVAAVAGCRGRLVQPAASPAPSASASARGSCSARPWLERSVGSSRHGRRPRRQRGRPRCRRRARRSSSSSASWSLGILVVLVVARRPRRLGVLGWLRSRLVGSSDVGSSARTRRASRTPSSESSATRSRVVVGAALVGVLGHRAEGDRRALLLRGRVDRVLLGHDVLRATRRCRRRSSSSAASVGVGPRPSGSTRSKRRRPSASVTATTRHRSRRGGAAAGRRR